MRERGWYPGLVEGNSRLWTGTGGMAYAIEATNGTAVDRMMRIDNPRAVQDMPE